MAARLLIIGKNSLIARLVLAWRARRDLETAAMSYGDLVAPEQIAPFDAVLCCALDPRFRSTPYDAAFDAETHTADLVSWTDAHFIMLSSRKVYAGAAKWNAHEDSPADGEGAYGRNKREAEKRVMEALGNRATVLRLANLAAFEYPEPGRRSFLALLLRGLKDQGIIRYDMSPDQRRDFIPFPHFAPMLEAFIAARSGGVYNAGSGIPLRVGDLAEWVMEGFGSGSLEVADKAIIDEFVLNMEKTRTVCPHTPSKGNLQTFFKELGVRLRAAG